MSLLRQDMLLPESSIHDFGRDLVISIQYLHSNAIIYCDLKPSNILLDENGRIKLGGFGLSRRLSDINKTSLQQLPPVRAIIECCKHCLSSCRPYSVPGSNHTCPKCSLKIACCFISPMPAYWMIVLYALHKSVAQNTAAMNILFNHARFSCACDTSCPSCSYCITPHHGPTLHVGCSTLYMLVAGKTNRHVSQA